MRRGGLHGAHNQVAARGAGGAGGWTGLGLGGADRACGWVRPGGRGVAHVTRGWQGAEIGEGGRRG